MQRDNRLGLYSKRLHQLLHILDPPFFTIWEFFGSVTTLALPSAGSIFIRSSFVIFSAKKCWLNSTLLSSTQPSVFPSVFRCDLTLPEAGHEA